MGGSHDVRSVKAAAEMEVGLTMATAVGINQQRRDILVWLWRERGGGGGAEPAALAAVWAADGKAFKTTGFFFL